ncbi:hypothetical protein ACKI1J_09830 [Streptomyces scabiei]|uniref:hypothetical protein n=1 Tax=Streptomyces scabiei TaxID=1930 RepID=UPI0038F747DB
MNGTPTGLPAPRVREMTPSDCPVEEDAEKRRRMLARADDAVVNPVGERAGKIVGRSPLAVPVGAEGQRARPPLLRPSRFHRGRRRGAVRADGTEVPEVRYMRELGAVRT